MNPRWRPFVTGLKPATVRKAISIIDALFSHLVYVEYVPRHPRPPRRRRQRDTENKFAQSVRKRFLDRSLINAAIEALDRQDQANAPFASARAKYLILLFFHTGLRIAEAQRHTMGHFIRKKLGERKEWFLDIVGKGKKARLIPVPDEFLDALVTFRRSVDLPEHPQPDEAVPLVPAEDLTHAIGSRRIDQIIHDAFAQAATSAKGLDTDDKAQLRKASAHWLRHSYGTYLAMRGVKVTNIRDNMGHSSLQTTNVYMDSDEAERHADTRNHSLAPARRGRGA